MYSELVPSSAFVAELMNLKLKYFFGEDDTLWCVKTVFLLYFFKGWRSKDPVVLKFESCEDRVEILLKMENKKLWSVNCLVLKDKMKKVPLWVWMALLSTAEWISQFASISLDILAYCKFSYIRFLFNQMEITDLAYHLRDMAHGLF